MELPYTYKFSTPVQHGEDTITELVFKRRPVADDIRDIHLRDLDLGDNIIKLTARLTAYPPSAIKKLDIADILALSDVLSDFFPTGPKTGDKDAE